MKKKQYSCVILCILCLAALYIISLYNYLFFHILAETFSIIIAYSIFIFAWNSRDIVKNNYFLLLGISFLFVGLLDLMHTIAYHGMGVFTGNGNNLSAQLWIGARYIASLSLMIAPLFIDRKIRVNILIIIYSAITSVFLLSVFYWKIYPDCFIEGVGLTFFMRLSEYLICGIYLAAIYVLLQKQEKFHLNVFRLLVASIVTAIVSEVLFTFNPGSYSFSDLLGHYFEIISFYLMYKAIIETGIFEPYTILFREVKVKEQALKDSEERYRTLVNSNPYGIQELDVSGTITFANKACQKIYGYEDFEIIGRSCADFLVPGLQRDELPGYLAMMKKYQLLPTSYQQKIRTKLGIEKDIEVKWNYLQDETGHVKGFLSVHTDITERKKTEKLLFESEEKYRLFVKNFQGIAFKGTIDFVPLFFHGDVKGITGYTEAEFTAGNPSWDKVIHPDDVVSYFSETSDKLRSVPNFSTVREYRIIRKDGLIRWVYENIQNISDNYGKPIYVQGSIFDITERKKMEDVLQKERDYLRKLHNSIGEAIFTVKMPQREIEFVNKSVENIFGYKEKECIGQSTEIFYPDKEGFHGFGIKMRKAIEQNKESMYTEQFLKRKNGEIFPAEITITFSKIDNKLASIISIIRDITDRRKADEMLRINEASLNEAQSLSHIGSWTWVVKTDTVQWSDELYKITGVDPHQPPPAFADHSSLYTKESWEILRRAVEKAVHTGKPYDLELDMIRPDGQIRYTSTKCTAIKDESGHVVRLHGTIQDITERKKTEKALKESEERFKVFFESSPDSIFLADTETGIIVDANPAAEGLLLRSHNEIVGLHQAQLHPPNLKAYSKKSFQEHANMTALNNKVLSSENTIIRSDGVKVPVSILGRRIMVKGRGLLMGVFRDMTELKQMEAHIRASLEEKKVLLREVHHRVKNNFQIILSLLRLQSGNYDDVKLKEAFRDSESRIRSMSMVHEMLYKTGDLAHIDLGMYIQNLTSTLFRTYKTTSDRVDIKTDIKDITLNIDVSVSIGLVITEFVSNSLKHAFTRDMSGEINIQMCRKNTDFRLTLSDNGKGLPPEIDMLKAKTFGLRLIRNMVQKQIGGTIEVKRDKGTMFIIKGKIKE